MADVKTISKAKDNNSGGNYSGGSGGTMSSNTGAFKYLTATKATIEELNASSANINDLKSNNISSTNISSAMYTGDTVSVSNVDTNNLQAEKGYVTELDAPVFRSDNAEIKYAGIKELKAQKADIDTAKIRELLSTNLTTDYLTVLKSAHFFELIIDQIKSAGGSLILTPADGFELYAYRTWDSLNYTYLYWVCEDDAKGRYNMWQEGDQAICQNFNNAQVGTSYNVSNKFWWAYVLATSGATPKWVRRDEQGVASTIGDSIYDTTHPSWRKEDFIKADGYVYKNNDNKVIDSNVYEALTDVEKANYSLYDKAYFRVGEFGNLYYVTYEQYMGTADYYDEELGLTCRIRQYCQADCKRCHWIRISHTNCDSGSVFEFSIGDNVSMLGSQTNSSRQSAIYIAAYDGTYDNVEGGKALDPELRAPLIAQYRGINDFNLSSHRTSYFDARSAEFYGTFKIQSNGEDDGTNILDHIGSSTLMVNASNLNINIPCDAEGKPIDTTASYFGTDVHILYGSSEQTITSGSYTGGDGLVYMTYYDSTAYVKVNTEKVSSLHMVTPIEVKLGCQYGQEKTTVTFNKIMPGQNGSVPSVYELICSDTMVKFASTETSKTITIGLNKYDANGWKELTTIESNDFRIISKRSSKATWETFAGTDVDTLPRTFAVKSEDDWVTFKLLKKAGTSWDTANGYAADLVLDTQTIGVIRDGKNGTDGKPGQDGTGTSGEVEKVLWKNKQFIVDASGNVTLDLLGQLQYIIGSTVQASHDWTNYSISVNIPEIHATWTSEILFDNSTTTSSGKFHTGVTGSWDSSSPIKILSDYFTQYATSLPDRALFTVNKNSTTMIEDTIPLIFKAGAVMEVVDNRIHYAVLDPKGSLANVVVTADNIDQIVRNTDSWSQINQRADEIVLRMKETGIDITNENITINANNTNFFGNIKLFNSNDGLTIFDDNNLPAVNIQKSSIGTFGANQNVQANFGGSAGTYTYVMGSAIGSNDYKAYMDTYDTSNGFASMNTTERTPQGMIIKVGQCSTGNVLSFSNIYYTIKGDTNSAWNGNINDYKIKFVIFWLNTDHIVKDTGWITPTRNSSGEFVIPNQSYTVTDAESGNTFNALLYFRGPNGTIDGTRNKYISFKGGFRMSKTVSRNTKIGIDGMYSMSENGQLWCSKDNIGIYYNNINNNAYGYKQYGMNVTANGVNMMLGSSITNMHSYPINGVSRLLKIGNGYGTWTLANYLNGKVGWGTYNGRGYSFIDGMDGENNDVPRPDIVVVESLKTTSNDNVIVLDSRYDTDGLSPIGRKVTIINRTGNNRLYLVVRTYLCNITNSNYDHQSYIINYNDVGQGTINAKGWVRIERGEILELVHIGNGFWQIMNNRNMTAWPTN